MVTGAMCRYSSDEDDSWFDREAYERGYDAGRDDQRYSDAGPGGPAISVDHMDAREDGYARGYRDGVASLAR